MLQISPELALPMSELQFSFARSGGPGGQHVNTTCSKVLMKWHPASSSLPPGITFRFQSKYATRLDTEGFLLITSQLTRERERNIDDCCAKLIRMLRTVLQPPRKRVKTKPTRAAVERRLEGKRVRAAVKRSRSRADSDD